MQSDDKPKIMLVDDDKDILTTLSMSLKQAGFEVYGFLDPVLALQYIEQDSTNRGMLISDIRMPHMNGFQLIRKVKKLRPHMKIIMMTAYEVSMPEFREVFPTLPVDKVVKKPFVPSKLIQIIKET